MSIIDTLTAAAEHSDGVDRAQLLLAAGEYAEIDGVLIDLRREQADVTGVTWYWTGDRDADGQPLMQCLSRPEPGSKTTSPSTWAPVPLLDVYRWHGPLVPLPGRPQADDYRAALLDGAA